MSIAEKIRSAVQTKKDTKKIEKNDISKQGFSGRALLTTAAAYHKDKDSPLTEDQTKQKEAMCRHIASLRGLDPQELERTISSNDLSKEMFRLAAGVYLREEGNTTDTLNNYISSLYEKDGDKGSEARSFVENTVPHMTLSEYLEEKDEDKKAAFLASLDPADKAAYTAKETQNLPDDQKAGKVNITHNDPDWAHKKDDDDFKIEQGDIIEYLMKDVILSSAAWATNRVTGFVGGLSYQAGSSLWHYVKDHMRKAKYNPEDPDKNKPVDENKMAFDALMKKFDDESSVLKKDLDDRTPKTPEDVSKIEEFQTNLLRCVKHHIPLKAIKDDKTKQTLTDFQKNSDAALRAFLKDEAGKDAEAAVKAFEGYIKAVDEVTNNLPSGTTLSESDTPKIENYFKDGLEDIGHALKEKMDRQAAEAYLQPEILKLQREEMLFAKAYTAYKISEEYRKNPSFVQSETLDDFSEKASIEASAFFWKAQQNRDHGLSNTALIALAEQQKEDSVSKAQKKSSKKSPNLVEEKLFGTTGTNQDTINSLSDAAKNTVTIENFSNKAFENIDQEIASLSGANADVEGRRKALENLRTKLSSLKEKGLSEKTEISSYHSFSPKAPTLSNNSRG